jgi:dUTP pyrophosphatase
MDKMKVKLEHDAYMLNRSHVFDAGADIKSREQAIIPAHGSYFFDTGVHIGVPEGMMAKVENRSSMFKKGLITTGVIDCGYTGSIGITLHNLTDEEYHVYVGDKIAQIVFYPIALPEFEIVSCLDDTERGDGGFGSTGR